MSTWLPLLCAGKIRGIKDAKTGQQVVRWDGVCDPTTDWGQANWRLILAAPDLLQACEDALESIRSGELYTIHLQETLYDAIAKARG